MATKHEIAALLLQIDRLQARLEWAEAGHHFIGMRDDDDVMKARAQWEADEPEE